ncbi:TIGR03088 family PEP-CTERM/XrtA system glycosyltransferase [Magnetospira sp. QH-2]|uniref:TIGR03088 family PEP-CTERM/XrtA system glycosyltransferase n=1 Tax=Magnetospira sp. (strain QH-2) TaxID=1288970 RepID=UPI0003E8110A|nr:TIGR03088 family PEP-CTERM/XrtA system glycosyltransferase [Magnetospira sp. QH-2]CCQ73102.1 putative GT4 : distantly related to a-1, 3-glucosyltransferase [Magnetospira sp. QH-2]
MSAPSSVPLVVHVIDQLGIGGLEVVLVNLINNTPTDRYRHAIICLRGATDFKNRITVPGVSIHTLGRRPGKDFSVFRRMWSVLRKLRPAIVHSHNLPTIDMCVPAKLAGVRRLVHSEHGWDISEERGSSRKYNMMRKVLSPLVDRYVPVSKDIETWLRTGVGLPASKVLHIYNGVDTDFFHPAEGNLIPLPAPGFDLANRVVFGTVGRMQTVKDQVNLAKAFVELSRLRPDLMERARLAMIGDGDLKAECESVIAAAGLTDKTWLPGARNDVAELLRGLNVYVLPSISEGISISILEAMSCGLPVAATRVGGNPELVLEGETGLLMPSRDPVALAEALATYMDQPELMQKHGAAGRQRIEQSFSVTSMVNGYLGQYDQLLGRQHP